MKIIRVNICIFLIVFSVLSASGTIIESKYIEENFNDDYNLKKQLIDKSGISDYWNEQDKLLSTVGATDDYFGCSVSIDGNYAIIGAYGYDESTGSAYIFKRDGTSWTEEQKLTASDGDSGDFFGSSVSIHENLVIIGAYGDNSNTGSAYIFNRSGTTWIEEQKLTASDGEAGDFFGSSVSINGDIAIIGAYGDDSFTGSVYAFNSTGSIWSEYYKLEAFDRASGDRFGNSVSFDGTFAIIGAYGDDSYTGSAYILEHCCYWKWREKVNVSGGLPYFGWSVSIEGDYAIIGAPDIPDSGSPGSAYIFKRDENRWFEHVSFDGINNGEYLGVSVSIDGGHAIAGAYGDDGSTGIAYIFNRNETTWTEEQKLTASDGETGDYFGICVSISAGYTIIGAYGDEENTGSAYVFIKVGIPDLSIEISGGYGIGVLIKNIGENETNNLDLEINVKGGWFNFVDKTFDYTIDLLPGESRFLTTPIFLGLGKVYITASTDFKEKTVEGIQFVIYTYVK